MIGWLLLLQGGLPTVGDTIWVRRMVAAPPGRAVRAAEWAPSGEVEALGRPQITLRGDSAEVAYPVTLWAPGPHPVEVPGPLLVGGDGRVDSLPAETVTLTAASVLPAGAHDTLHPQPATPTVALLEVSLKPLLAMWGLAVCLLAPVHLWWRRRGRLTPVPVMGPTEPPEPDVSRWAEAGEVRAVIAVTVERLRGAIAAQVPEASPALETESCLAIVAVERPGWPVAELTDLLRALDLARFSDAGEVDALALRGRAGELERRIAGAGT